MGAVFYEENAAELADAADLKSTSGDTLRVRSHTPYLGFCRLQEVEIIEL
jgi:hypothetical protein